MKRLANVRRTAALSDGRQLGRNPKIRLFSDWLSSIVIISWTAALTPMTTHLTPSLALVVGILVLVVGVFCGVVWIAVRSWSKTSRGQRIASVLLLTPHFLIIVCILVSLACGHPPQGSVCWNRQFACAVLVVFILPVPAVVGTLAATVLLLSARRRP